jgi:hypothetical protein
MPRSRKRARQCIARRRFSSTSAARSLFFNPLAVLSKMRSLLYPDFSALARLQQLKFLPCICMELDRLGNPHYQLTENLEYAVAMELHNFTSTALSWKRRTQWSGGR